MLKGHPELAKTPVVSCAVNCDYRELRLPTAMNSNDISEANNLIVRKFKQIDSNLQNRYL